MKVNKSKMESTILGKERLFILVILAVLLVIFEGFNLGLTYFVLFVTFFCNFYVCYFFAGLCFLKRKVFLLKEFVLVLLLTISGDIYVYIYSIKGLKLILAMSLIISLLVFAISYATGDFLKKLN